MSIKARFPGNCEACGARFGVGTMIEWSKASGSRHLTCPGTIVHSKEPLNSPGRAALQGRGRRDFFLGEKTEIVRSWAMDGRPDESDLGKTILSKKGSEAGKHITCVGLAAHWVSQDEADDFDLIGTGGDFSSHWSVTMYYRLATEDEAAPVIARAAEAAEKKAAEERAKQAQAQAGKDFDVRVAELTSGLVRCGCEYSLVNDDARGPYVIAWTEGSSYKQLKETTSKITGAKAYLFPHGGYDDYRLDMFVDEATAIEAFKLNRAACAPFGPQTPATASAWLEKYRGCVGTEYHEWLAKQEE